MGGSSLKKAMFWKKKKSPLNKAFGKLKRAFPSKKKRKKSIFHKLKKDKKTKRKSSLTKDKKTSPLLKKLTLGHKRKESIGSASGDKKAKGGLELGRVGEQIKKKITPGNKKETMSQAEATPPPPAVKQKGENNSLFKIKKLK